MPEKDQRVDAYIAKSEGFAKPILTHLRKLVFAACPNVTETIKWGMPFYDYKGPLCSMAAFKAHGAFSLWKHSLIPDPKGVMSRDSMGALGKLTKLDDLPTDKVLTGFIKAAMKLNEAGIKVPVKKKTAEKKALVIPEYFAKALQKNKKATATFEGFAYSHKKEYLEWITEAKTEITRQKRMATTLEWLTEGKSLNWKYQQKK